MVPLAQRALLRTVKLLQIGAITRISPRRVTGACQKVMMGGIMRAVTCRQNKFRSDEVEYLSEWLNSAT